MAGLLLGLGMTLVVQSSSATIGVLQGVARQAGPDGVHSLLGLAGAVPVLLGDNVGTTITAILAAAGGTRDAKRAAAAHCCFNLSGSLVCLLALPWFVRLVELLPAALGIRNGDVKLIKNAGGMITGPFDSAVRSLLVGIIELGVEEVMVIGHNDCGVAQVNKQV